MKITASLRCLIAIASLPFAVGCASASAATPAETPHRQLMDRYFEIVDSKKPEELPVVEGPGLSYNLPIGKMDAAMHVKVLQSFGVAFPNFQHVLSRCVEAGDLIACEGKFVADHTGPLAMPDGSTLPATNKHVDFPIVSFGRVEGGKFVEYNGYFDVLGFLGQLGVGPAAAKQ